MRQVADAAALVRPSNAQPGITNFHLPVHDVGSGPAGEQQVDEVLVAVPELADHCAIR